MNGGESATGLLRERQEGSQRVTFIELFFDLVYVFAVTQLAHLLGAHLDALGAAQTLLVLLAVWWAWIDMVWITNWFDPDRSPVRLLIITVMLLSLIMSAAVPQAFGDRGLVFAAAYVAMQVAMPAFAVATLGSQPALRLNYQRILAWSIAAGVLWLAGGIAGGTAREAIWLGAVVVNYGAPAVGFATPGLGRSRTTDWTITGAHMAERFQLFLIIALGESILDTGATFGDLHWTAVRVVAVVVAFVGTVALWWIYFHRSAEGGRNVIATSADPGRLGRSAYTYFHLPMVAGIIVTAVGDELTIAQPDAPARAATMLVILGGAGLFLAGHALYKRALSGKVPRSRPVAIAALAALMPVGLVVSPLVLAAATALVLVAVGGWDARTWWVTARQQHSDHSQAAQPARDKSVAR